MPVPPDAPDSMVARPSPMNARPEIRIEVASGHGADGLDVPEIFRHQDDGDRRDQGHGAAD